MGGSKEEDDDVRAEAKGAGGDVAASKWVDDDAPKKSAGDSKEVAPAADSGEAKGGEEESLVHKVAKFFFEDGDFANSFEDWVNRHADVVDLDTDECKLEYTQLHLEFQERFEAQMTDFIEAQGSSVAEFYDQVKAGSETDPWGEESIFALILVATTDFDVFMQMMREAAQKLRVMKAAEAK